MLETFRLTVFCIGSLLLGSISFLWIVLNFISFRICPSFSISLSLLITVFWFGSRYFFNPNLTLFSRITTARFFFILFGASSDFENFLLSLSLFFIFFLKELFFIKYFGNFSKSFKLILPFLVSKFGNSLFFLFFSLIELFFLFPFLTRDLFLEFDFFDFLDLVRAPSIRKKFIKSGCLLFFKKQILSKESNKNSEVFDRE